MRAVGCLDPQAAIPPIAAADSNAGPWPQRGGALTPAAPALGPWGPKGAFQIMLPGAPEFKRRAEVRAAIAIAPRLWLIVTCVALGF